jgi:transposase InsO family protein
MAALSTTFPIAVLARALAVSRSGFYAHLRKAQRPRRRLDATLRPLLRQAFFRSRSTDGAPRLRQDLRALGHRCGRARLQRLMREEALQPRQKRAFRPRTTDARHPHPCAENWLAKVPAPSAPGQVWVSDFTYLPTAEGWLFLAFTLDLFSRRCVAHHCLTTMTAELTCTTFARALHRFQPPPGLLHHSDRGVQYACADFRAALASAGVTQSMSRTANPYDNAAAESFVATLKAECFHGPIPASREVARLMAFDYLESFYNTHRRHSSLGFLSPLQFELLSSSTQST